MEKAALDTAGLKQLAHIFQRVHRLLHRLGGKAVHQVSVHQNARL